MKKIPYIDIFSGVGGFRLGLKKANYPEGQHLPEWGRSWTSGVRPGDLPDSEAGQERRNGRSSNREHGFSCVWSCEIDKWASAVYEHRFGEAPAGDIRRIDPEEIPDHDLLCGGFPCQDFSVAGKRRGLEGTRGTLFYEICRIARVKRPQMLFLENVKGLLSADNRRAFGVILESLGELGYDVEWQVLNSTNFGVPQNRERVFIIGHLGGFGGRQVFPFRKGDESTHKAVEEEQRRVSRTLIGGYSQNKRGTHVIQKKRHRADGDHMLREYNDESPALTQQMGTGGGNVPMILRWQNKKDGVVVDDKAPSLRASRGSCIRKAPVVMKIIDDTKAGVPPKLRDYVPTIRSDCGGNRPKVLKKHRANEIRDHGETVPTLTESHDHHGGANPPIIVRPVLTPDRPIKRQHGRRFKENGEEMFTLTGQDIHGVQIDYEIRRLTPLEFERLQGFPDDWTSEGIINGKIVNISNNQRYKMMGNAVTTNVIESIARRFPQ